MEEAFLTPPYSAIPIHPRLHRLRMDVVLDHRYAEPVDLHSSMIERPLTLHSRSSTTGRDKSQLQALLLPICTLPILLPTPLLEPRYFLIPYILMRAQVVDVPVWGLLLEGAWYAAVNAVTMWVFLYKERVGVGRFMW